MAAQFAVLIAGSEPTEEERSVKKIIDFFAIPSETRTPQAFAAEGLERPSSSRYAVMASAASLSAMLPKQSAAEFPPALRHADLIFVFDFDDSSESARLVRSFTGAPQARVAVNSVANRRVTVTKDMPHVTGALSGITAQCSSADSGREFRDVYDAAGFRRVLSTSTGEVCFQYLASDVPVFLSANPVSLDIDRPVDGRFFDVRRCFSSVVPTLLFLKRAFPAAVGSGRKVGASLIVDDPALKRRYGFMRFDRALAAMRDHAFCTTVAFIPWNWRRTNRRTAAIFRDNTDRYGLVLHGCDHTANEFGTSSVALLNHKVKAALRRAKGHHERTGLRISPIMVFPQGVFTPDALYVLKCNNFTAAVNTEVNAVGPVPPTRVRELWDVAIMQYSSFPVFTRRYMSHGLENFAFDMFLGKPCLLVGHHDVFRDDGRELMTFIDSLNSLAGGVKWGGLDAVIARSYSSRGSVYDTQSVRMFANEMVLESGTEAPARFRIEKQELDQRAISTVTCDGRDVYWTWESGFARFDVDVPPGRAATIRVEHVDPLGESTSRERAQYRMAVRARRYLSELRDDYICRSEFLNACTGKMRRLFR